MRKALIALGMSCLLLETGILQAQDKNYDTDRDRSEFGERSGIASPQFLIYRRAVRRSEARASRIAARKWYGISTQRPNWSYGDINAHGFWRIGYQPWRSR